MKTVCGNLVAKVKSIPNGASSYCKTAKIKINVDAAWVLSPASFIPLTYILSIILAVIHVPLDKNFTRSFTCDIVYLQSDRT